MRSYFGRQGCRVNLVPPTGTLQMQQFVALKARLEDGSLRVWAQPQLIQDLRRVRTTDGGKIHLPKFRGSHCDTVVALASAAWELKEGREATLHVPEGRVDIRPTAARSALAPPSETPGGNVTPGRPLARPPGVPDWQWKRHLQIRRQGRPQK